MIDPNKFEHSGQVAAGCDTGLHLYETDPNAPGGPMLIADGALTKMVMRCKRCGAQHEVSAPLGLNDVIARVQEGPAPTIQRREQYVPTQTVERPAQQSIGPSLDDAARKLFG